MGVLDTPEVSRVYIGSFWDEPLTNDEQRRLFESEENDLYTHLSQLPRSAAVGKLNDLIKRARLAKVHMYLIEHLRKNMPSMMGKEKAKKKMIDGITDIYKEIAKERNLALGDFPDPRLVQEKLKAMDFSKFKAIDKKKMDLLENMLSIDVPKLLQLIPEEASQKEEADLTQMGANPSPFAVMKVGGQSETTVYQSEWLVAPDVEEYRADFMAIGPDKNGKITGQKAKQKMVESKLP